MRYILPEFMKRYVRICEICKPGLTLGVIEGYT
jgi:hypothetical protein